MKESIKFWISWRLADLGLFVIIVLSVIFLCAIAIGISALISVISKKAKEKQKEYWERTDGGQDDV